MAKIGLGIGGIAFRDPLQAGGARFGRRDGAGGNGNGNEGGTSQTAGGQAGNSNTDECSSAAECPEPEEACLEAICDQGACSVQNREVGATCSDGVCTDAGACVACIPTTTDCDGDTPRLCSENGEWAAQAACEPGSKCRNGHCRGLEVNWYLQADSSQSVRLEGVGVDSTGQVYTAGGYLSDVDFGGYTDDLNESGVAQPFIARVAPEGGEEIAVDKLDATSANLLSVAPNGNQYVYLARSVQSSPSTYHVASYANNGSERFIGQLYAPEGAYFRTPHLVHTANGNGAFLTFEFGEEVQWIASLVHQSEVRSGSNTFLGRLNGKDPAWMTSYPWSRFRDIREPSLALGNDGYLYVAGKAGNDANNDPVTLGDRTFESSYSIALLKVDPSDGSILDTQEIISSDLYTDVLGMVPLASGDIVVVIRSVGDLTLGEDLVLPEIYERSPYLVKFDQNLEPVDYVSLGEGRLLTSHRFEVATGQDDNVYLAGSIVSDFDFGAGLHVYQGPSSAPSPALLGDGFIVGYNSDLELLFSQTYGSPSGEQVAGLAADAGHLYFALTFSDTIDLHGTTLNPLGGTSSVLVKYTLR